MATSLLGYYAAIERASDQMVAAARASDWTRIISLEGVCMVLIAQLRSASRTDCLAPHERDQKEAIMQRILANDAEVRELTEHWIDEAEDGPMPFQFSLSSEVRPYTLQ